MRIDIGLQKKTTHSDKTITINGDTATIFVPLYTITGVVYIRHLYGIVETATLAANLTAAYLDIFPTGGAAVVMTKIAGAPAISDFEEGSILYKNSDAGDILDVQQANVAMFLEAGVALEDVPFPFIVGKKVGAVTSIRFSYIAGADYQAETGQITWHCEWIKQSHDGLVVAA